MRTLVTGAAGFVGANIVRRLCESGTEVVACVRPGSDLWRLVGVDCEVRAVDLGDASAVSELVDVADPRVIVNAAAHGAYSWQNDLDSMLAVNIAAVDHLIELCVERGLSLLHLGSSSEYGPQIVPPTEFVRPGPNSRYAVTKLAGTHLVCDAVARRGLVGLVLRLYSVYGPWEEAARLMPTLAGAMANGRLPPLVDPDVARDFVHVDDVVDLIASWIENPVVVEDPPIINVGSGVQTTLRQLVGLARTVANIDVEPQWGSMPNRSWDTTTWQADPGRAAQLLGWRASTGLDAGLQALMDFVSEHARYRPQP